MEARERFAEAPDDYNRLSDKEAAFQLGISRVTLWAIRREYDKQKLRRLPLIGQRFFSAFDHFGKEMLKAKARQDAVSRRIAGL